MCRQVDKTGFFCLVSFVRLITGCFRVLVDSLRLRFHASVWISVPVDKILFISVLLEMTGLMDGFETLVHKNILSDLCTFLFFKNLDVF